MRNQVKVKVERDFLNLKLIPEAGRARGSAAAAVFIE
jgi:hypothetical protein